MFLCAFCFMHPQHIQAPCFLVHPDQWFPGREERPDHSTCPFPRYTYSPCGPRQAGNLTPLKEFGKIDAHHWPSEAIEEPASVYQYQHISQITTDPDPVSLAWSALWTQLLVTVH